MRILHLKLTTNCFMSTLNCPSEDSADQNVTKSSHLVRNDSRLDLLLACCCILLM